MDGARETPQTWRVECHDVVHKVVVDYALGGWFTGSTGCQGLATPLAAVQVHAAEKGWSATGFVAPGEMTRAELVAERDALRAAIREYLAADAAMRTATRADNYEAIAAAMLRFGNAANALRVLVSP